MNNLRLSRLVRTESSEIYLIWRNNERIGQVDIHYATGTIYATLLLEQDLAPEQEETLVSILDEDIVSSYLPRFEREDFVVHVFRAHEIGRYTDPSIDLEDMEGFDFEDDDEEER
ncbi:MAG: hypothetical protein NZ520_05280 [bacterium]|nr:hypothetical protein [bacterium]MDW8104605.1 hypothetical protein [Armatimonadota bacterium]